MLIPINFLVVQIPNPSQSTQSILDQLLTFIYSIAHYIGLGLVNIIQSILPMIKDLETIVDPVGFLVILTIFIILVAAFRKLAWFIVIAGWLLISARITLMVLGAM